MNDPGLDGPIAKDAKEVERDTGHREDGDLEEDQNFLDPSRWWAASTAFPLLAGTFGPMASAFNICALIESWRVIVPPGGTEEHGIPVTDPHWLIAVNSVSLALALIANFALLFNMARRLPFKIAQPITIIGWYISSFLLIGIIAATTYDLPLLAGEDRALTSAFYYAIMAAALYIIVASLMVVTVYGAYAGHYEKEFKLTMSQRTLMLQTISYLTYLLCGAAVFAHIEGWTFVDTVYWANYTLLTIGIGDYAPATHLGRSLLFPYAIGGIIILGLVIGSIRSLVLERGEKKISARMMEKTRQRVLKKLESSNKPKVPLNPLSKAESNSSDGMTERDRRKREFLIMRQIQESADTRKKWTALLISAMAWLTLWLVGAVVFWKAERNQDWSYFESVYFSYTSILTIGYGDFVLDSNSGRPFFVFWTLLAVPTLTILISNMGDTIVKGIRDATLWLGELTVLPEEGNLKNHVHKVGDKLKGIPGISSGGEEGTDEQPPGILGETDHPDPEKGERHKQMGADAEVATDNATGAFERKELDEANENAKRGDKIGEDIHLYHYLLMKEIRKVMKDANETPPKKYSYHEWAWFLRLMGEDENSSKFHRKAPVKEKGSSDGSHIASAANDVNEDEDVGDENKWSWLGARSPLMGNTEEAEWVLERLSLTLERELKKQRDQQKGADPNMKDEGLKKDPRRGDSDGNEDKNKNTEPLTRGSSTTIDDNS